MSNNPNDSTSSDSVNANEWYENFQKISAESNKIFTQFFLNGGLQNMSSPDLFQVNTVFMKAFSELAKEPEIMTEASKQLYEKLSNIWVESSEKFLEGKPLGDDEKYDKRFTSDAWHNAPAFKALKDSYLTYADWLLQYTHKIEGLDKHEQDKVEFCTRQFLDAISPSNFLWTNPDVLRATIESNGKNLTQGLKNLAQDLAQGKIGQTDFSAFELGKNLATTKGSVVFESDLFQLIQYAPTTKHTYSTPLLFIPAWINKFYIADLQPKNSLIKWLVDQGYTVFLISWVNPTEKHSEIGFDDYILQGLLRAVNEVMQITNQPKVNAIGYCLGGTLLATALAYLQEKKQNKIGSATFLTTMLDFSDVGEISVFIDEEQISALEKRMSEKGFLDGSQMAMTFNMLRSNDLIWSFVINNYLLGKTPFPFDILYWNSDSTRMPAKMHSYYLRNMYLKNLLAKPNAIEVAGVKIDLRKITNPAYFLSTKKDHIAPWKTTYLGAQMLPNAKFTIADSGHVAGVVNPPSPEDKPAKYHHWTYGKIEKSADDWLKKAQEMNGSWWTSWHEWNKEFSGKMIDAVVPKNEIEPAPGRYVRG